MPINTETEAVVVEQSCDSNSSVVGNQVNAGVQQSASGGEIATVEDSESEAAQEEPSAEELSNSHEAAFLAVEFTAKDVQAILRSLTGGEEKIGLALLNYYSRTNLVPCTGKTISRGRNKYTYADLILLCWLFRMKAEGLPVNRFRKGIDYLRTRVPRLCKNPADMVLLTDGKQLFIKHRVQDKSQIAEVLTGRKAGQYVWVYAIGSLIEEVNKIIDELNGTPRRGNKAADAGTRRAQIAVKLQTGKLQSGKLQSGSRQAA